MLILSYTSRSRNTVFKNNGKLHAASLVNEIIPDQRDQGYTRPKVLILVPFRQSAFEIVSAITTLCAFKLNENKKKFTRDYSIPPADDTVDPTKPDDHNATFTGHIDDNFVIGVRISNKSSTILSEIYQSDIIIASPLGLRMKIGNEGDKKQDFDFLSSIEMCILDQADVLAMQNWEHVGHIFEHMNRLPMEARGCDFSRVKTFNLDERYD
jgi:U3 small nucleolar RNA-associated protein 25